MKISAPKYSTWRQLLLLFLVVQTTICLRSQVLPSRIEVAISLSDLRIGPDEAQISYPVLAGHNYFVEYRDCFDSKNPDCAVWIVLPGAPHNTGVVSDAANSSERYYRVRDETIKLTALPGRDQEVLLGETVVLNGTAAGADGPVRYLWSLSAQPVGSGLQMPRPLDRQQVLKPTLAGEYRLELVVREGTRQSVPGATILTVRDQPLQPPTAIAVRGLNFTSERDGLVDPTSAIRIALSGPVDPASLATTNILLHQGSVVLPIKLNFDAPTQVLTITPSTPLVFGGTFTLEIQQLRSLVTLFSFSPFSTVFRTMTRYSASVGGTVLNPDGKPLAGVIVRIAGQQTTTDNLGHFSLEDVATGNQALSVDPAKVTGAAAYTPLFFLMKIVAGPQNNTLPGPIVLTAIDLRSAIDYPNQTILRNPAIPGLEIDFTGVTLRLPDDGSLFEGRITLSPVRSTEVPMPFPGLAAFFWTVQPGGLLATPPAKITAPLPIQMEPGSEVELWAFNHGSNQWVHYGTGVVNADGLTATSRPGEGLPFTGWGDLVLTTTVKRRVVGQVTDADGNPLHGVEVRGPGGKIVWTDYQSDQSDALSGVTGSFHFDEAIVGYNSYLRAAGFQGFLPITDTFIGIASLSLKATDIAGNVFEHSFTIRLPTVDKSLVDGGLPDSLDQGTIQFDEYPVIDGAKNIHLHADMHVAHHSHFVQAAIGEPIQSSARYQKEVRAIVNKLASMGFRENSGGDPLSSSQEFTPAAVRATKLFQALVFEEAPSAAFRLAVVNGAHQPHVDGIIGGKSLEKLNEVHGVLWTQNDASAKAIYPNAFDYEDNNNRWMYASIVRALNALSIFKSGIFNSEALESNSGAIGQRNNVPGGISHHAGGQADTGWLDHDGNPGLITFYNKIPGQTVHFQGPDTPSSAEENITWRIKTNYDRGRTRAFIQLLHHLGATEFIFNDPQIPEAVHLAKHHTHIHFTFPFFIEDALPPGTGGAPLFSAEAAAPAPRTLTGLPSPIPRDSSASATSDFSVQTVSPSSASEGERPATPLIFTFTQPVDSASLTATSVQLLHADRGAEIGYTLRLASGGQQITLIPNIELPEAAHIELHLSEEIRNTSGASLNLNGDSLVTSFETVLSSNIVSARFDRALVHLTRNDLSGAALRILGQSILGATREVTPFLDGAEAVEDASGPLKVEINENGVITRLSQIGNGPGILYAFLNNGVIAATSLELELAPKAHLANSPQPDGPIHLHFDEPVNTRGLRVIAAHVAASDGKDYPGDFTPSDDGQTLTFKSAAALPKGRILKLLVDLRVTDGRDNQVDLGLSFTLPHFAPPENLFPGRLFSADRNSLALAAGDLNHDGHIDIVSLSQKPTTGAGALVVLLGKGNGSFLTNLESALPFIASIAVVGDLTGDGHLDLVIAEQAGNRWAVLPGNGDGSFGVPQISDPGDRTGALALVDLNKDGHLDLVRINQRNVVSIFLGRGDGSFDAPTRYEVVDALNSLGVADLNGDGNPDIVAVNNISASVLLGNGDGTFKARTDFEIGFNTASIALADMNGDGHLDLATVGDGGATVLPGDGNGRFGAPHHSASNAYTLLSVADLDGDGNPDLITSSQQNSTVSVLFGTGGGAFGRTKTYAGPAEPSSLVLADMDEDGHHDLLVGNKFGDGILMLLGNEDRSFDAGALYPAGQQPLQVLLTDLNNDGIPDALVADNSFTVTSLLGRGDGTFSAARTTNITFTSIVASLDAGDLNGDGNPDLVVAVKPFEPPGGKFNFYVLLGDGHGGFAQPVGYLGANLLSSPIKLADVDGDGHLDLVAAVAGSDLLTVRLGHGDGTFSTNSVNQPGVSYLLAVADLNRDGRMDVVASSSRDSKLLVFLGSTNGTLNAVPHTGVAVGVGRPVAIGDMNGDGTPDLVALDDSSFTGPQLTIILGTGDGHFGVKMNFPLRFEPSSIKLGDINGDGNLDIVLANPLIGSVTVLLGDGRGGFVAQGRTDYAVGSGALSLDLGDLDGDEDLDIVTVAPGDGSLNSISVLLNRSK